ncbi:uncharacterized protein YlxW (UPF0749 family) [Hydrogenispora ethanolica]|uniref:Uncharacterized protein YlxW (UPF0749 family) n=1 Tax=Hydrogenispora ethanolica TaxID=1082276 RepID=A0A4R1RZU1_HYDET|nr:DUF881 domain-containing protein [Hydrogenispora ethanolica]TCL72316.1 uncharacterized protein YlxW (UPF0749 family) [Hydrogenispora ethanolica]
MISTNRSWQLGVGIVAMVLGMLLVFQFRTEWKIRSTLPTRQINELAKLFSTQKRQLEKYEQEIADLRKQVKDYDRDREVTRLKMSAGLVPLSGKGVRIVLSDSDKKLKDYEDPVFYIVHYDQLELLVNELWAAGAEAISVNKNRIGSTTGFSCAGTTILIDTKRLAPPYVVEAIGDPENLKSALMMPGGFVEQQILSFNLKFSIQPEDELLIPAYKGSISFEHAKMAEEGE